MEKPNPYKLGIVARTSFAEVYTLPEAEYELGLGVLSASDRSLVVYEPTEPDANALGPVVRLVSEVGDAGLREAIRYASEISAKVRSVFVVLETPAR